MHAASSGQDKILLNVASSYLYISDALGYDSEAESHQDILAVDDNYAGWRQ
jgi:hypothetical protein